jgi:hypothetical protein
MDELYVLQSPTELIKLIHAQSFMHALYSFPNYINWLVHILFEVCTHILAYLGS